jgi:putative transposase
MADTTEIRHGRHCVFYLYVHLVFVTKYRRGIFTGEVLVDLRGIFAAVCQDFSGELVELDGEEGHVHLLVNYPPTVSVSALVNSLKGVFSRLIRKRTIPASARNYGPGRSGPPRILLVVAAVRPYP